MSLTAYIKPYASVEQQIAHLRSKNLIIKDDDFAADQIQRIGYERLRIYMRSRRDNNSESKFFKPDISFEDIVSLYECDAQLRAVCFPAIGQFENSFRNAFSEVLSQNFGSHPYDKLDAFKDANACLNVFQSCVNIYAKSKDRRAKHYRETYSTPSLPPIWVLKEFMTFGASSRIFQNLSGSIRTSVAKKFRISSDEVFKTWIVAMVDLRNDCAHHDRLFNRNFQKAPKASKDAALPVARSNSLKGLLESLEYLNQQAGLVAQAEAILRACPAIRMQEAGY